MRDGVFIFLLPVLVFMGFLALAMGGLSLDKDGKPLAGSAGRSAPEMRLPQYQSSAEFTEENLLGKKVLVNFFASWCLPCLAEHEFLFALKEAYTLPIYGIVYKDKDAAIEKYLTKHGNPFAAVALDREGRSAIDWGVTGVPETFLLSADGKILAHSAGPLTADVWEKVFVPHVQEADKRADK